MVVTSSTKYAEFQQYEHLVSDEGVRDLYKAAEKQFKPCHELTLNEFWGLVAGNYELLGDMTEPSVLQTYWCRRFSEFCDELAKSLEALAMTEPNSEYLQQGCVMMTPQENMLTFVREYFGLPSFLQAGERTIGEYVLARKDAYNAWKVRKNFEAKQLAKLKTK